ncbi:hypothetical protein [Actinomadura geliboluensis]|uniref:hypothetical protein n=1 Tax=Actinomadura geliboluensis TaxID=882440 RepID=UPI003715B420
MSSWREAAAVVIGILAFVIWVSVLRTDMICKLWAPVVRSAGGGVLRAAVRSAILYIVGMIAFGLVLLAVHAALDGLFARAAALVLSLLYAPVAFMPMPDRSGSPYGDVRRTLVRAGASERQARACAWATGPLAFAGLAAVGAGIASAFAG